MQRWREGDPAAVQRLEKRYQLLQQLICDFREITARKDSTKQYPPAEEYLSALETETRTMPFDQMTHFVDMQLIMALANVTEEHPIYKWHRSHYRDEMEKLAPHIIERIAHGDDFEALLTFLAVERRRIAEEAIDLPTKEFGAWRPPDVEGVFASKTHEGCMPEAYRKRFAVLVSKGRRLGVFSKGFLERPGTEWTTIFDSETAWTHLEGQAVPLTVYLRAQESPWTTPGDLPNRQWANWLFNGKMVGEISYPAVALLHTDPAQFPILLRHCQQLYHQFRAAAGREALLHIGAQLHWHLSHATFFRRGSAATAEWLLAALFSFKEHPIRWLLKPDLEVLATPKLEDFLPMYPSTLAFEP